MRCAPYARLSKNRGHVSENVPIQLEETGEYAQAEGWTLVVNPLTGEPFSDDDISASKYSKKPRPGYNALRESIKAGQVDVVLVTEMPRLYRRLEELLDLIRLAEITPLRKIETTAGTGYNLSTAEGIHNAISAVNNAMRESAEKSERVRRKLKANARKGLPNGGRRPYGYTYTLAVRDNQGQAIEPGRLVVHEPEAAVIREAVELLLGGRSLLGVVKVLNERGYRTVTGALWRTTALREILTSKLIVGIREHNGVEHPGTWEPIIDRDTWERVQLVLNAEKRLRGANQKGRRTYLLTGLVYCGATKDDGEPCGAALVGHGHQVNGALERRYFCAPTDTRGQARGCGKVGRIAEPLEALIGEAVLDVLDSPRMGELLAQAAEDSEAVELLGQYQAQKLKLGDLVDDYASGLLDREQLTRAKSVVESAMEATRAKLERLQSGRALASVPVGKSIREAWREADPQWRLELVKLLVERVVVHPGRPGGRRWPAKGSELAKRLDRQWAFDPDKVEIDWKA